MDEQRVQDDHAEDEPPRVRFRRMAVAAIFVVVIPVSVQEEEGWHLPGLGSSHHKTPAPLHTGLVGTVSSPHPNPTATPSPVGH